MSRTFLVGLGNPGSKYRGTRHNIGFDVVDFLASRHGLSFDSVKSPAPYEIATGSVLNRKLVLLKPLTYMNRSGDAVAPLVRFYKIPLQDLLVIHDDIDLPLGKIRFVRSGGHGGHNGIRSIIQSLGSRDFPRLKIGIGRPTGPIPVDKYVLSRFDEAERKIVDQVVELCVEAIECFLREGIEAAMNEYNGREIPLA